MLRAGDKIRHKPSGRVFTVVRREGNDVAYSVIVKPTDGRPLPDDIRTTVMGMPGCFRLLEAGYWIHHTYEVVS
jgi:hypothetical protein